MKVNIITSEDLELFKTKFFSEFKDNFFKEIKELFDESQYDGKRWIKSHQVQRFLGISPGTLQNLRINGTIPYSKLGGVIFYDQQEINKILETNKQNIFK